MGIDVRRVMVFSAAVLFLAASPKGEAEAQEDPAVEPHDDPGVEAETEAEAVTHHERRRRDWGEPPVRHGQANARGYLIAGWILTAFSYVGSFTLAIAPAMIESETGGMWLGGFEGLFLIVPVLGPLVAGSIMLAEGQSGAAKEPFADLMLSVWGAVAITAGLLQGLGGLLLLWGYLLRARARDEEQDRQAQAFLSPFGPGGGPGLTVLVRY